MKINFQPSDYCTVCNRRVVGRNHTNRWFFKKE